MKRYSLLLVAAAMTVAACSPKAGSDADATETALFSESTDNLSFELEVEWPSGKGKVAEAVRDVLLDVLYHETVNLGFYEEPHSIARCQDTSVLDSVVTYYGREAVSHLSLLADEDAAMRIEAGCDPGDFPGYECSCGISRISSSDRYWVYQSSNYVYLGGAHGGVTGAGCLTFRKEDGVLVTQMVDPSDLMEMQPLLRKGLMQYFADCQDPVTEDELFDRLFLEEDGVIPLPVQEPYPDGEGLVFVYQQYEIAPYAMGMPAFTLSLEDVRPYLTEEAADLLF